MRQEDPVTLFRLYEAIRSEKVASSVRYFQLLALMVTVVWGGFGLFATQLEPKSTFGLSTITIGSIVAVGFALYWTIAAASFRDDEIGMDNRLRTLEERVGISWLFTPDTDHRSQLHPLVRVFAIHTRFPIGMVVVGIGGCLMWLTLLIVAWLIHFDAL